MGTVIKAPLTKTEADKIQQDLIFISLITKAAKNLGLRIIVHGGYSVDGALGKITKPHKDIDIQIYGNSDNAKEVLQNLINTIHTEMFDTKGMKIHDKGRSTFYHNFLAIKGKFCADLYYIQIEGDPFDKKKTIIKDDGDKNEIQKYRTHQVTLNGFSFEATLPEDELKDKRSKKERADINQDITNLESLLQK